MGAIQAYRSLSDQLEPFWLLLESHFGELIEPERLYLLVYMSVYMYLDLRGAKMALQETPIKYGGMAPSREPFWLL